MMTTADRDEYIVSAAANNALTTVLVEKAASRDDIGRIAADSVIEVILGNCWRVSAAKQAKLERLAAERAVACS